MSIFGVLGLIEFEAIASPEEFESTRAYTYATHQVVEDAPKLQWLAPDLEEITLRMGWHQNFTSPQAQYALLVTSAELHFPLPLVFGNGSYRGLFVIIAIRQQILWAASNGTPIWMKATVVLKEFKPGLLAFLGRTLAGVLGSVLPLGISPSAPAQPGVSALTATPAPIEAIESAMAGEAVDFTTVSPETALRVPL